MTRIGIETRPVNSPMFALESMFPRALPINRSSTRQPKRPRRGDTRSYVEGQGESIALMNCFHRKYGYSSTRVLSVDQSSAAHANYSPKETYVLRRRKRARDVCGIINHPLTTASSSNKSCYVNTGKKKFLEALPYYARIMLHSNLAYINYIILIIIILISKV